MDIEAASLEDLEDYLRSFGGFWAAIPDSLTASVRVLKADEQGKGTTSEAVARSRLDCYTRSIQEFAKVCQRLNPATQV